MLINCKNPECFSFNRTTLQFCHKCSEILVNKLSIDELYDMFYETDAALTYIIYNDPHEDERISAEKCKKELHNVINRLMLLKIKKDDIEIDWPL